MLQPVVSNTILLDGGDGVDLHQLVRLQALTSLPV